MDGLQSGAVLQVSHAGQSEVVTVCIGPGEWLTEVTVGPLAEESWPSRTRAAAAETHRRAVELCRGAV